MTKPLAAACVALLATACETGPEETVFENGDRLVVHTSNPGELIGEGDLVTFHLEVYNADSLVNSTRAQSPEGERAILPPVDTAAEGGNTFLQTLRRLRAGDSATIYQTFDSLQPLPPGIDREAGLRVELVVVEVGDSAAATAFREDAEREQAEALAARAAYAGRRGAVQDSVEALLTDYRRRGAAREGYTTTASGLMYKILEPGTGAQPQPGEYVTVSYYGALSADAAAFDDSFGGPRGEGITFPLGAGQVIPGWDEGIALLREGARAMLIIPAEIGYGERGSGDRIPPDSELAFYVQLDDIQ